MANLSGTAASMPVGAPGIEGPERSKAYYIGLVALLACALEITGFEFTFVFPAIPKIATHFQTTQVSWVFTILYIVGGLAVPILGKLSDRVGKKKVLLGTMVSFTLGSALCAFTNSFALFLAGRGLQAIALAASVIAFGLIRDLLPPRLVPLGLGGIAAGVGISTLAGPLIGGALIDHFGFKSCFVFLFVYGLVVIALMALFLPETTLRIHQHIDYLGAALLGGGAAILLYGLGRTGAVRWWYGVVGVVLIMAFVGAQRVVKAPLMDPKVLVRPRFVLTLLTTACLAIPLSGWAYILPQLLQAPDMPKTPYGHGLSAWEVALWQGLPQGVGSILAGIGGGYLARRYGTRLVILLGGIFFALPCFILAMQLDSAGAGTIRSCAFLLGVGTGFFMGSTQNMIADAVPADKQGVSGAMNTTIQSIFGGVATAVLASVLTANVAMSTAKFQLFTESGYKTALLICGFVALGAVVIGVLRRDGREPATGGVISGVH